MTGELQYQPIPPMDRQAALAALASEDPASRIEALLALAHHDPDWRWVQERCIESGADRDSAVRGTAALCFGHLARIHRHLDLDRVLPVLQHLRHDEPFVAGRANEALSDLEVFLGKH